MRWLPAAMLLMSACASSTSTSMPTSTPMTPATLAAPTPPTAERPIAADTVDTVVPGGSTPTATSEPGVLPVGFETTRAVVTEPDGTVCEICVWLADDATQRSRGLKYVTDLGPAEAMAFRYPEPHTGTFWMENTPLPLTIAFFAPDGAYMSSFDMETCLSSDCPNYRTPDDFLVALEVPQGGLEDLGVGAGSSLELLDLPCDD